ncbi:MAG: hypothetical protein ABI353_01820 [Isosphaeraceae bacterium]
MRYLTQALILAVMALSPMAGVARAQSPIIDRVEEDWELVIEQPDTVGAGPQITTTMSPQGDNSLSCVAFNLNYRGTPTFQAGGLEVQVWINQIRQASSCSQSMQSMNTPGETITWTQRMALSSGGVAFDVLNGASTTWGKFGQGSNLNIVYNGSTGSPMQYSPDVSVKNSGVGWQSNHVTSMTLKQVRYYANNMLVRTDDAARPINLK